MLDTVLRVIRPPGALGTAMLAAGALGLSLALLAAVRSRSPQAYASGVAALVVAIGLSIVGAAGVVRERSRIDGGVENAPTETAKLRARRAGYERARSTARAGLALAAAPLFGGLAGVLAPVARRRKPRPQSIRMPRSFRSQARYEMTEKRGLVALSACAFAALAFAADAIAYTIPLPGPELASDDPAWDARDALDVMRAGKTRAGCEALERACERRCEPASVPGLASAVSECVDRALGEADAADASERAALLDALSHSHLPLTLEERERIREATGGASSAVE